MSIFTKISAIIKISRPVNVFITVASVIIAGIICAPFGSPNILLIYAAVSAAFINAAGNIINDIFDIKTDEINKKERVLQKKLLSVNEAEVLYAVLTLAAFVLAFFVNRTALYLSVATAAVLFFYSYALKKMPLLGNVVVALLTALAFIYGGIAVDNINGTIIPAIFAFLINLSREIIKDMEDITGDKSINRSTLPVKYGFGISKKIILITVMLTILFPFYLLAGGFYKTVFFVIVLLLVNPIFVYILISLFKNDTAKNLARLSVLIKTNMVLGLLAIVLGI